MTAPELLFLAPPPLGDPDDSAGSATPTSAPRSSARPRAGRGQERPTGLLRMTRGARAAATGMKIADSDIQRCIDAPADVSPDPTTSSRTRFSRGDLVVLAGADGMVLRVDRRTRRNKSARH